MIAILRRLHRWVGLVVAAPMVVLGLTGVVLTLAPMLPDGAAVPVVAGAMPRADADILAAAVARMPAGARPTRYLPANDPGQAAIVQFGAGTIVRIDPVSLAPVGPVEPAGGVMRTIHSVHENFAIAEFGGRTIVGWCGIGLVFLVLAGVPIWWPAPGQWRAAFAPSLAATGLRFHRRLHGAVGIWIALVLFINAFTGAMLGFPQAIRGWLGLAAGFGPPGRTAAAGAPDYDLTAAMALARTAAPGTVPRFVLLPARGGEPIRVILAAPGGGASGGGLAVIDPSGRRLLSVQDPRSHPPAERFLRLARDLHAGAGLGPVWRACTVAAGLALPIFGVTGVTMWLLRQRQRRRADTARLAALQPGN